MAEAKSDDDAVFAARVSDAMRAIVPDYHLRFLPPGGRVPTRVARTDGDRSPRRSGDNLRGEPQVDIRLLSSNIGCIRVSPLISTAATIGEVEARMRRIASAAALIYDVRGVPGGDPAMVTLLSSYAFDRPTKLVATQVRGEEVVERWTRADRSGPSFGSVPVAVLIDGRSASAAEALAFGFKITGRAELFGERSRGAGHSGGVVPLDGGFGLWLPTGRAFDPATGKGWDQVGIEPLYAVPAERALDAARAALMAQIARRRS
ncbi:MAG: S41 family peptidase [Acidobacteria bacterium]|nr:S41 family peptidase [Acidobacteriota bacterium]